MKIGITLYLIILSGCIIAQNLEKIGKKDAVSVFGNLQQNFIFSSGKTRDFRGAFSSFTNGQIGVNILDVQIPVTFSYSNRQFKYAQPFNQFAMHPSYKWIKSHFGFVSMDLGDKVFANYVFTGAGIELTPGAFTLKALYGRLLKGNRFNPQQPESFSFDRYGGGYALAYRGKIWDMAHSGFFAKDRIPGYPVINQMLFVAPASNSAFSFAMNIRPHRMVALNATYAISGWNRNIRSGSDGFSGKTKSINKLASVFRMPEWHQVFGGGFQFNFSLISFRLNYERIEPGYITMGVYYFNADLETWSCGMDYKSKSGKFSVATQVGLQNSGLSMESLQSSKRYVGSVNTSWTPNKKWTGNIAYSSFTNFTRNRPQLLPGQFALQSDTLQFYQLTQSGQMMINRTLMGERVTQNFLLNASLCETYSEQGRREDLGLFKAESNGKLFATNVQLSHNINTKKNGLNFQESVLFSQLVGVETRKILLGPGLSIGKTVHQNWRFSLQQSFQSELDKSGKALSCSRAGINFSKKGNGKYPLNFNGMLSGVYNKYIGGNENAILNLNFGFGF